MMPLDDDNGMNSDSKNNYHLQRIYSNLPCNGPKILVDRLWPRGIAKDKIDEWQKDLAPSNELRKWFNHEPTKFDEFRRRYFAELDCSETAQQFKRSHQGESCTLLYAAKDEAHNNAVVLKEWLEKA